MSPVRPGQARVNRNGQPSFSYANEADIQSGMADLARAYGWRVETEVVVPGWGRMDLVLHEYDDFDNFAMVVEFKHRLTKLASVRKAFQQADGYYRWLTIDTPPIAVRPVILAAAECDWAVINDLAYSYRSSVHVVDAGVVVSMLRSKAGPECLARARSRAEAANLAARLANKAVADLTEDRNVRGKAGAAIRRQMDAESQVPK